MTTNTALAKIERSHAAPADLGRFLETVKPRLEEVLPAHINPEALIRVVQTFGNQNERLLKCTESSLLTSLMLCSQLGLPPNTPQGFAWLIPFWNGRQKTMECKVMFGYKGLAELVRNSGEIGRMNSGLVYEHEVLSGTFTAADEPPDIIHRPSLLAPVEAYADDKLVAAYALIVTKDGQRVQRILRRAEILKRRDASQAVQKAKEKGFRTPWDDWFGPQCRKTALRALCGSAEVPKSTELLTALTSDVDAPAYDELQNVVVTQADGFRQQAAAARPPVIDAEALPAAVPEKEPETPPAGADKAKRNTTSASGPKKATKAAVSRLWQRWAKITDCDPAAPLNVDKESFKGFVAARIGEERARDSSFWTTDDCKVIGRGLDELRGEPSPAEPETQSPASPAEGQEQTSEPEPAGTRTEALRRLKDLRSSLDMPWDEVREIAAVACGVTAKASSRWSTTELLAVTKAMRSAKGLAGAPPSESPERAPEPGTANEPPAEPETRSPASPEENQPPPSDDDALPENEVDPEEQEIQSRKS